MYRKLIKFGESTHVVSLPREWVLRQQLQKGDNVFISQENDSLIIDAATKIKQTTKKEKTLQFTEMEEFRLQLIAAYINNYKIINVIVSNPKEDIAKIREIVSRFLALEIIEQTSKKVVIKDFCNLKETEPKDLVRRIDIIVRAMIDDAIACLKGEDCTEQIKQKEVDVNRLSALGLKVLHSSFSAEGRKELELSFTDIFYLWELFNFLEKTADQVKRMVRYKDPVPTTAAFFAHLEKTKRIYEQAMNVHYKKDMKQALKIRLERAKMYDEADAIFADTDPKNPVLFEKIKNLNSQIASIASNFLRLHPEN